MKFFSVMILLTTAQLSLYASESEPESPKSPKSLAAKIIALAQSDNKEDREKVGQYIAQFDSEDVRQGLAYTFKETNAQSIKNVLNAHGANDKEGGFGQFDDAFKQKFEYLYKSRQIIEINSFGHHSMQEQSAAFFLSLLEDQAKKTEVTKTKAPTAGAPQAQVVETKKSKQKKVQ